MVVIFGSFILLYNYLYGEVYLPYQRAAGDAGHRLRYAMTTHSMMCRAHNTYIDLPALATARIHDRWREIGGSQTTRCTSLWVVI